MDVKPGDRFVGIKCEKCGTPQIIGGKIQGPGDPTFEGPGRFLTRCPKCLHKGDYGTDQMEIFTAEQIH